MDQTPTVRQIQAQTPSPATRIGQINSYNIQRLAINRVWDILGPSMFDYGYRSGRRCNRMAYCLKEAQQACGYNMNYKTLMRWIDYFNKFGEVPATSKRNLRGTIRGIRASGMRSFTQADRDVLRNIMDNNPQFYLDEFQDELFKRTGKVFHTSTIWRQLQALNYSLKVAIRKASQQDQAEVDAYHYRLLEALSHPRQLIYIDETAKSANASRRKRAWSTRGEEAIIPVFFQRDFDKRYTLIGACDYDGFVQEACHIVERESSRNEANPERGTVDAERFEDYVEQYLVPNLGSYIDEAPRSIVVMDNASIHCSPRVEDLINEAGAILIYTAPYSPEFNPIELMFGEYKKYLQRHSLNRDISWMEIHIKALQSSVTPEMAVKFFWHCKVPMMHLCPVNTIESDSDSEDEDDPILGIFSHIGLKL